MMYLGNQAVGMATSLPVFSDVAKIEIGSYTPTVDEISKDVIFSHSLGSMPDFLMVMSTGITADTTYTERYMVGFYIYKLYATNFTVSNLTGDAIMSLERTTLNSTNINTVKTLVDINGYTTTSSFTLGFRSDTDKLKANATYYYIIGKFKEVTLNAS